LLFPFVVVSFQVAPNKASGYAAKRHLPTKEETLTFISNQFKRLARENNRRDAIELIHGLVPPVARSYLGLTFPAKATVLPAVCAHLVEKDIPEEHRDVIKAIDASLVRYYLKKGDIREKIDTRIKARENEVTQQLLVVAGNQVAEAREKARLDKKDVSRISKEKAYGRDAARRERKRKSEEEEEYLNRRNNPPPIPQPTTTKGEKRKELKDSSAPSSPKTRVKTHKSGKRVEHKRPKYQQGDSSPSENSDESLSDSSVFSGSEKDSLTDTEALQSTKKKPIEEKEGNEISTPVSDLMDTENPSTSGKGISPLCIV
jgi:hypothetical protein